LDRKWKIYRKKPGPLGWKPVMPGTFFPAGAPRPPSSPETGGPANRIDYRALAEQTLLHHNDQVGVLVNGRGQVLHICGRSGRFLEPPAGDMTANILPMAREGLRRPLTTALHHAVARKEPVHGGGPQKLDNGVSSKSDQKRRI